MHHNCVCNWIFSIRDDFRLTSAIIIDEFVSQNSLEYLFFDTIESGSSFSFSENRDTWPVKSKMNSLKVKDLPQLYGSESIISSILNLYWFSLILTIPSSESALARLSPHQKENKNLPEIFRNSPRSRQHNHSNVHHLLIMRYCHHPVFFLVTH